MFSSGHRSTSCVQISWNLDDGKSVKSCVAYLTKNTKFRLALKLSPLRGSRQMHRGHPSTMYSECSRFHPNLSTFGRVIAERVNNAKTRSKVNPIFGCSLALSWITINSTYFTDCIAVGRVSLNKSVLTRGHSLSDMAIIDGLIHRLTPKNCNILFYGGFMLGWV